MSTRDSSKSRCVLGAFCITALVYVSLHACLTQIARGAERSGESYPWKEEDYLRLLLPSLFEGPGRERIMIAGPSEAREALLHEEFESAFPGWRVLQGALSLGTFDDMLISLEYIERVYGAESMPGILVLGLTTRFVANLPRDASPLAATINRYSGELRVERDSATHLSRLEPKLLMEGLMGYARFLVKQQKRYKAALAVEAHRLMLGPGASAAARASDAGQAKPWIWPKSRRDRFERALRDYASPYKYQYLAPRRPDAMYDLMTRPTSFWYKTHAWEPVDDARMIQAQFERLQRLAQRHGIRVFVINLPEYPMNIRAYRPGRYEAYLEQVRECLNDTPFLDLRAAFGEELFFDVGHVTLTGARIVTARAIDFLRANGAPGGR